MRRKVKKVIEVNLDISENGGPVAEGCKKSTLAAIAKMAPNSVDAIIMNGVLEHRSGEERVTVMKAVYKALKVGGKALATMPHWATAAASMSPWSKWPPISPEHLGFFSKDVRKRSNYSDPRLDDIDFDLQWSELYPPEWQTKADANKIFAAKHYTNVLMGLAVTLTKVGKK